MRTCLFRFFLLAVFFIRLSGAEAQVPGFIHIQSENNHAYLVRWNDSSYLSSPNGYLVIPKVPGGDHTLMMSFAPETSPGYTFNISITGKPRGFSLRQAADNSWSLFDMIDFSIVKGSPVAQTGKPEMVNFSQDPMRQPLPENKPAENTIKKPAETLVVNVKKEPPVSRKESLLKPAFIQKVFDKVSPGGIDQVYVIANGSRMDTVALFIPALTEDRPKTSGQSGFIYRQGNPLASGQRSPDSYFLQRRNPVSLK